MLDPVTVIDVPVMLNGRKATISKGPSGYTITFPQAPGCFIPAHEILHTVVGLSRVGIGLVLPTIVVPGSVKTVTSFVLTPRGNGHDWPETDAWGPSAIDHTEAITLGSACGRTEVQFALPITIWTSRTCTVVKHVKAVVLQRTMGGMSTYDAHVIPACSGNVVTIELLPHRSLGRWERMYGEDMVVNAGPDPVPLRRIQESQLVPDIRAYILDLDVTEPNASGSDSCSEWDGSSSDESMYESAESFSDCSNLATSDAPETLDGSTSSSDSESSLDLTDTPE